MKVNSLKLTIQDMPTSDGHNIAAVMGTVFIDNDEYKRNEEGNILVDSEGQPIPIYETINFTTSLSSSKQLKACIKALLVEALTLKNLQIAKENGELSHFLTAVGGTMAKPKRGSRSAKPKKR